MKKIINNIYIYKAYIILVISFSSGNVTSRLVKNSGIAVLIVKYMSSFFLHFSKENLQPRRNVSSL